jgi:small subunit ribosomal protein S6
MKTYELMVITKGALTEEGAKDISEKVKTTITTLSGEIVEQAPLGRKKFAYLIKGQTDGIYDFFKFSMDEAKVTELKSKLNYMDSIVRYLLTVA